MSRCLLTDCLVMSSPAHSSRRLCPLRWFRRSSSRRRLGSASARNTPSAPAPARAAPEAVISCSSLNMQPFGCMNNRQPFSCMSTRGCAARQDRAVEHVSAGGNMEDALEQALAGGNVADAVARVGNTVRKPSGYWTPAVEALLAHLEAGGFTGAPRPLG